ncbi:unnamed protein product, partial [Thelazia callipaeda]|uniref:Protein aurora borealis n=1 Tax=Thelazia callipaeda TaxID=103827 RepID=A0A0N5CSR3_THECL
MRNMFSMDLISPVLPSTVLTVECDVFASNINNRLLNSQKAISSNPGLNYIWQDEKQRCERRGEKLCYESSQSTFLMFCTQAKERPYPETENEQNHIRHLHTYIKSISSNSSCSALEQDVFSVPLGPSTVEKANDFQNDNFETDINIFDEVLFFDDDVVEDGEEINEQEFEEDVDLNTKVTELCKSVSASNDTDLIKSDFNDSDSSSDEDSFSLNTEAPGPSRIEFIKLRKDSKEFSRQSSGSDDLFDRSSKDFETGTASILSCDSDLRNFEQHCHSAVSSKNSSQASNSTRDFTTCGMTQSSQLDECWAENKAKPEIIQTEQWLRPCKRLPLRKRVSVPSNEYFCSAEEYTESSLLEPNNCETDDQLFTESSVELSFYD